MLFHEYPRLSISDSPLSPQNRHRHRATQSKCAIGHLYECCTDQRGRPSVFQVGCPVVPEGLEGHRLHQGLAASAMPGVAIVKAVADFLDPEKGP